MSLNDQMIVDAENTLMNAKSWLMQYASPTAPRAMIMELVDALERVLDLHAELSVTYEPDESPDMELVPYDDDEFDLDLGEPDETTDEG